MKRLAKVPKSFIGAVWQTLTDPQFFELMLIAASVLLTGTWFYHQAEGWSILDSFYFSVTTLTTVGFGDLAPTSDISKFFTAFYILTGVGILLGFVNAVATHAKEKSPLDRFFNRKH